LPRVRHDTREKTAAHMRERYLMQTMPARRGVRSARASPAQERGAYMARYRGWRVASGAGMTMRARVTRKDDDAARQAAMRALIILISHSAPLSSLISTR